jgi:creatinine amidohydrolase
MSILPPHRPPRLLSRYLSCYLSRLRSHAAPVAAAFILVSAPAGAGAAPATAGPAAGTSPVMLEDLTWTELRDAVRAGRTTAIVPVGGTEQSGPALALGKHNVRVRALAERIAREMGSVIVAPVLAYVPEGTIAPPSSHMRFPGTLSVPTAVFEATLASIGRSLRAHGFRDVFFLGDHGGYQRELVHVADQLNREWSGAGGNHTRAYALTEYYEAATSGYAQLLRARGYRDDEIGTHAALSDTSMQMAVAPDMVRPGVLFSAAHLDESVGIYGGDPRRANAQIGQIGLDEIVRQSVAAMRARLRAAGHEAMPAPR